MLGTSTLALMELLVVPKREGNARLAHRYRALLRDILGAPLIALEEDVAEAAGSYRAMYGFKTPVAVQLASAVAHGYDVLYTNDLQLARCPDLDVLLVELPDA